MQLPAMLRSTDRIMAMIPTISPHFSQGFDSRQVNLTRFDLFCPEKRSTFLEGAGVFDDLTGNPMMPDLIPFLSTRIGFLLSWKVPRIKHGKERMI